MKPYIIGVAGGSGSGKSTLAFNLLDRFPGKVLVFHIDDYFRPEADIPHIDGLANWDSPDALYAEKMFADLAELRRGRPVTINTKSPRHNPDFLQTGRRIPVTFEPQPLIIVEGFLALHFPQLRSLMDYKIYLDAPFELHASRRVHGKLHDFPAEYDARVLRPMHETYVAPSKQYADLIIDVTNTTAEQAAEQVLVVAELQGTLS